MQFRSTDAEQTFQIARELGKVLVAGDVLALYGDLGAGKTVFTKGIAAARGVEEAEVTSPTYALINEYAGDIPIYHFDVYRLDSPDQLEDLGYEEYFYGRGITIIEWASKIEEMLPETHIVIRIEKGKGVSERLIGIFAAGTDSKVEDIEHRISALEELPCES